MEKWSSNMWGMMKWETRCRVMIMGVPTIAWSVSHVFPQIVLGFLHKPPIMNYKTHSFNNTHYPTNSPIIIHQPLVPLPSSSHYFPIFFYTPQVCQVLVHYFIKHKNHLFLYEAYSPCDFHVNLGTSPLLIPLLFHFPSPTTRALSNYLNIMIMSNKFKKTNNSNLLI